MENGLKFEIEIYEKIVEIFSFRDGYLPGIRFQTRAWDLAFLVRRNILLRQYERETKANRKILDMRCFNGSMDI